MRTPKTVSFSSKFFSKKTFLTFNPALCGLKIVFLLMCVVPLTLNPKRYPE
jgi:hypothetical protein